MIGHYEHTPYLWTMLVAPVLLLALAAYAWRQRPAPGALPFVVFVVAFLPWALGSALELAALEPASKVFWYRFGSAWQLPVATAALWFALEYADLGRWLNRTTAALLALPPVAFVALVHGDASHGLLCSTLSVGEHTRCLARGPAGQALLAYGLALALCSSLVFLWLFLRSPLHRWPAALCLGGHVVTRAAYLLDTSDRNPVAPLDATVLAAAFTAVMYALALLRFRLFELIPVARWTLIEQMHEGLMVLDRRERVVDLNPAAERALGLPRERARGRRVRALLPSLPAVETWPSEPGGVQPEIRLGPEEAARDYALELSSLRRGAYRLGYLMVLRDVTGRKQAQARSVEHQRARATLEERERVARELHDSLGQVLGYVKLQAEAARALLAQGQAEPASDHLEQLVAVAQEAHADVREFILGSRAGDPAGTELVPALQAYLRRFRATYGIAATLEVAPELSGGALDPMAAAQLLRIIQETLTNVRKHSKAGAVRVRLSLVDGRARAVVQDDGEGFDPAGLEAAEAGAFGLRFMRERAREVGGSVSVSSAPGQGTRVEISLPFEGRPA